MKTDFVEHPKTNYMHKIIKILGQDFIIYSDGRLFDINKGIFKKKHLSSSGYYDYCIHINNEHKFYNIHRLVAEAFIPNPDNKPCIDHINTIRTDNRIQNLRWVTQSENMRNPITIEKQKKARYKPIVGYDIDGNEICRFKSVSEAIKNGYSNKCAMVANGKRVISDKLYWKWL